MGTYGQVAVVGSQQDIVHIGQQCDGYPSGLGARIKMILGDDPTIVNGFGGDDAIPAAFNGMECLAAYLVGKLKADRIGHIYLEPSNGALDGEYIYTLSERAGKLRIVVKGGDGTVFYDGPFAAFDPDTLKV